MGGIRAALGGISTAVAVTVGGILAAAVIAGLVMLLLTITSSERGNANITQQRNSAANRERWSSVFQGLNTQIQADVANIDAQRGHVVTQQDAMDLAGMEQVCRSDVAAYNADTRNVLAVVPAGLPATYPLNTCGE